MADDPRPQRPKAYGATPGLPQATRDPEMPPPDALTYETPSQSFAAGAGATASRRDARGRLITVKKLSLLDFYRLSKLLGPHSNTVVAMDLASIAAAVQEIDGDRVFFPKGERELDHLMQRLDFDGLTAVAEALKSLAPKEEETDEEGKTNGITEMAKN